MGKQQNINVLVTGGGGFVGFALIKRLKAEGFEVTSFSRQNYPELNKLGIKQILGDLANYKSTSKATHNQHVVFHVAAKAGFWGSHSEYYNANVLGTQNIVRASKESGANKLILTSSASVVLGGESIENGTSSLTYPHKPLNHYTATKALSEQIVISANSDKLRTISLRPHIIWGPGDRHIIPRLLDRARSGNLRQIGDGKNRIDTIYIDNFIDAQLLAMKALDDNPDCRGKAYFVTNDEPVLLWEFLNEILQNANLQPVTKSLSQNTALTLAKLLSGFHHLLMLRKEPTLTTFLVKELSQSHWFDISDTKRDLGYSPNLTLKEGLNKLFDE